MLQWGVPLTELLQELYSLATAASYACLGWLNSSPFHGEAGGVGRTSFPINLRPAFYRLRTLRIPVLGPSVTCRAIIAWFSPCSAPSLST